MLKPVPVGVGLEAEEGLLAELGFVAEEGFVDEEGADLAVNGMV
jgi:hypothetical protein